MKRIIFSQYTENVDPHTSVDEYKKSQFLKYNLLLEQKQKEYAHACECDYEMFKLDITDYADIQFKKLLRFEELSQQYDEILYLDLDVAPLKRVSFFEKFDLNKITAHSLKGTKPRSEYFLYLTENDMWHSMGKYEKTCAKKAMLFLDDIIGDDNIINTGVIGMNKKCVEELRFSERLDECKSVFREAKEDNIYPSEMANKWELNNEVFITYMIERYGLPYTELGMAWNFIVDHEVSKYSAACHFLHIVNKNFQDYPIFDN